ncbi:MAG: DUF4405 domain-containing protein [Deltaproteobacteria bacterium]|nr:DUF4405 domain-containing protein [Deltaproteobacteria bacterium]
MNRPTWNYWIDVLLFTLMTAVLFIGVLLAFVMAEGPVADQSTKYFCGLHRHQWGNIHLWFSLALVALVALHVILHWNWIVCFTKRLFKTSGALLAIVALPAVIVLVVWIFADKDAGEYKRFGARTGPQYEGGPAPRSNKVLSNSYPASSLPHSSDNQARIVEINGRMSLLDIERLTGVSARSIARELGLPADAALNEHLGQLRRTHGFAIETVRETVNRLSEGKVIAVDSDALQRQAPGAAGIGQPGTYPSSQPERGAGDLLRGAGRGLGQGSGRGLGQGSGRGLGQRSRQGPGNAQGSGNQQQAINGQMSLRDIEQMTGVSARQLANRLGVPDSVALDTRLGLLRRQYGFTIHDVRAAIESLEASSRPR